jgi:AcrR family transcriptional regulator
MSATREPSGLETRGRPRLREDDEILAAALRSFASSGYEGMSLRTLNQDLGLSHGTINQRYGSKEQLYYAAIEHGFGSLVAAMGVEHEIRAAPHDDLERAHEIIRVFLVASARHPDLIRLMNLEGLYPSARLDYIISHYLEPQFTPLLSLLNDLETAGVTRHLPARDAGPHRRDSRTRPYGYSAAMTSRRRSKRTPLGT